MSSPDPEQTRRYVCPDCDSVFSTSSHLSRHSRVHTGEKNYKCSFPGCDFRCSRRDNLTAHYRIHEAPQPRIKGAKSLRSKGKSAGTGNISPVSSSSPSPTAVAYPRSPDMFRSPSSHYSSSANNPQHMMPPPLPPLQGPRGPGPLPFYNIEDQFNAISIQTTQQPRPHPGSAAPHMPYPRFSPGGPSPGYRGHYDAVPPMLQNPVPFQHGNVNAQQPTPPFPPPQGPSTYPYTSYQSGPGSMSQYPPNAPSSSSHSHHSSQAFADYPEYPGPRPQ